MLKGKIYGNFWESQRNFQVISKSESGISESEREFYLIFFSLRWSISGAPVRLDIRLFVVVVVVDVCMYFQVEGERGVCVMFFNMRVAFRNILRIIR